MTIHRIKAIQIGLTIIGTIVGAGFASGQEIYVFFSQFGNWGTIGIFLTVSIVIWISSITMVFANTHSIKSPQHFYTLLFGIRWNKFATTIMLFNLFAVSCVMLAGAGTALQSIFSIPYWTAALCSVTFLIIILSKQLHGLYWINGIVVPLLITFVLVLFLFSSIHQSIPSWPEKLDPIPIWKSILFALSYVSFNLTMALTVLLSIGAQTHSKSTLIAGSWIGGFGIGLLLLCSHFIMLNKQAFVVEHDLPLGYIAQHLFEWTGNLYFMLIYLEIMTTLTANAFGMSLHLTQFKRISRNSLMLLTLLLCLLIGQLGFARLLDTIYPVVGVLGLTWITALMVFAKKHQK